jgi:acetyl-CoA carboxylase biotin carboxyl carrier protein
MPPAFPSSGSSPKSAVGTALADLQTPAAVSLTPREHGRNNGIFPIELAQPGEGEALDLKELKEILQILEEKEIAEFELEEEGMKLRIRKAAPPSANHASAPAGLVPLVPTVFPVATGAPAAAVPPPAPAASGPVAVEAADSGLTIVKSPIVGTFYRTPDPNAPPFVDVGDRVRVGQVLCIIEAMKLMNEIEAEVAGEVVKVHRESGQPVQYGDPLFTVRPD